MGTRRFFLGMCLDYVKHWSVPDALRELFQNCLDAYRSNPENEWYIDYDEESGTVRVGNKKGQLSTNSLLLGRTSKTDKENQIGKFGEGYKVATVVLLRNGCSVTVYNYNKKEIWYAKLVNSRRYDEVVPAFDIQSESIFKPIKGNDLIFEVSGVTKEMWDKTVERNLFLRKDIGVIVESKGNGRMLLNEKFHGCIYVSGLYVCHKKQLMWGYDLDPSLVSLDRDRGLIDSFNLQFTLGRVIAGTGDKDIIKSSIEYWDGKYVNIYRHECVDAHKEVGDELAEEFVNKYGLHAIPVCTQEEFDFHQRQGARPVMMSDSKKAYIENSYVYTSGYVPVECIKEPEERFYDWYVTVAKRKLHFEDYTNGLKLLMDVMKKRGIDVPPDQD